MASARVLYVRRGCWAWVDCVATTAMMAAAAKKCVFARVMSSSGRWRPVPAPYAQSAAKPAQQARCVVTRPFQGPRVARTSDVSGPAAFGLIAAAVPLRSAAMTRRPQSSPVRTTERTFPFWLVLLWPFTRKASRNGLKEAVCASTGATIDPRGDAMEKSRPLSETDVEIPTPSPEEITTLLHQWRGGNREAFDRLIPIVYDELRVIASRRLAREWRDDGLRTTALVNEAYLKLVGQRAVDWQNRAHFF